MDSISLVPLTRVAGRVAALSKAGAPVDLFMRQARLPRRASHDPGVFLSARLVRRFFEIAARDHGADPEFLAYCEVPRDEDSPTGFVPSLRLALEPYLSEGVPSIELAAEIAGTSVRTLQRRLSRAGLSYSELVDELRRDQAMQRVMDRSLRLIDVALALGFSDQAHFTRAFRRWTGMTPSRFRRQLCTESLELLGVN